jgi:hypothetical protein
MGAAENCVASRSPFHGVTFSVGRKRSGPTGGSAKGTPRKTCTPSLLSPRNVPLGVRTTAGATAGNARRLLARKAHAASELFARKHRRVIIGIVIQFSCLNFGKCSRGSGRLQMKSSVKVIALQLWRHSAASSRLEDQSHGKMANKPQRTLSSESGGTLTRSGMDLETKIFSGSGQGENFFLDIPFYRTQRAPNGDEGYWLAPWSVRLDRILGPAMHDFRMLGHIVLETTRSRIFLV